MCVCLGIFSFALLVGMLQMIYKDVNSIRCNVGRGGNNMNIRCLLVLIVLIIRILKKIQGQQT